MEKIKAIKELMALYGYSESKATKIVNSYIQLNSYKDLCKLLEAKKNTSMGLEGDVQ